MGKADEETVVGFLLTCKGYIEQGKFDFIRRKKCIDQLTSLGMVISDIPTIVLSLTQDNYVDGPNDDYDLGRGGYIYVFGYVIDGTELYIKLKCAVERGCICLSFHGAEHKLTYPFLGGGLK